MSQAMSNNMSNEQNKSGAILPNALVGDFALTKWSIGSLQVVKLLQAKRLLVVEHPTNLVGEWLEAGRDTGQS